MRILPALFCVVLSSCSLGSHSSKESFSAYLRQQDPVLTAHIDRTKPDARDKIQQSFRAFDASLDELSASIERLQWYQSTAHVLRTIYQVHEKGVQDALLNKLGTKLVDEVKQEAVRLDVDCINDKYMVDESFSAAERKFKQLFEYRFHNGKALSRFERFLDDFTEGFYVLNSEDPAYARQYLRLDAVMFHLDLYLLFTEELSKLPDN